MSADVPNLAVVTYLRQGETLNEAFFHFAAAAQQETDFTTEFIVFAENDTFATPDQKALFSQILIQPRATKFTRLAQILETTDAEFLLSMDSDITPNRAEMLAFLRQSLSQPIDLAWGRIACKPSHTLTGQLVELDKLLSHRVLRPMLWALRLGISVPGQVMLLRCSAFRQSIHYDTFLDDAALGIFARQHRLQICRRSRILGYEAPSSTLPILFSQRRRWANGYAALLRQYLLSPMLFYVLVHGATYHLLEPLFVIGFVLLSLWQPMLGAVLFSGFFLTALIASRRLLLATLLYPVVFLVLHLWWMLHVAVYFPFARKKTTARRIAE